MYLATEPLLTKWADVPEREVGLEPIWSYVPQEVGHDFPTRTPNPRVSEDSTLE